jgi:hypothetical protein
MVADYFLLLVWVGGCMAMTDSGAGFWRSSFWPYQVGKKIVAQWLVQQ